MIITQFNLYKITCFYKYAHYSVLEGFPDMIVSAIDTKFHDKNKGMPSRACRLPKNIKTIQTNAPGNGSPARRGAHPHGKKEKGGMSPGTRAPCYLPNNIPCQIGCSNFIETQ